MQNKLFGLLLGGSFMLPVAVQAQPQLPETPWESHTALERRAVSPVYHRQWLRAPTKNQCAILALASRDPAQLPSARSRKAEFAGGWGVAYDLRRYRGAFLRSAYGVANSGTTDGVYGIWPDRIDYRDGTVITYGREGGLPDGKWLAYVHLPNGCFYNVWSNISQAHLLQVINGLRYVK